MLPVPPAESCDQSNAAAFRALGEFAAAKLGRVRVWTFILRAAVLPSSQPWRSLLTPAPRVPDRSPALRDAIFLQPRCTGAIASRSF